MMQPPNPPDSQPPTLEDATPRRGWAEWLHYRTLPPGKLAGALTGFGGLYLGIATLLGFDTKAVPFAVVALHCYIGAAPVMLMALFLPGWRPRGWWRDFRGALGWLLLTLIAVSGVHSCPHSVWLTVGPFQAPVTGRPCNNPQPHTLWYVHLFEKR